MIVPNCSGEPVTGRSARLRKYGFNSGKAAIFCISSLSLLMIVGGVPFGGKQPVPIYDLDVRIDLRDQRDVRIIRTTLTIGNGEQPSLAAFHVRHSMRLGVDLRHARQEVVECICSTTIGHMQTVDPGLALQRFTNKVGTRAGLVAKARELDGAADIQGWPPEAS